MTTDDRNTDSTPGPSDDACPSHRDGIHEPDWRNITIEHDGDETYIDVFCKHCGRSGCIGTQKTLEAEIQW